MTSNDPAAGSGSNPAPTINSGVSSTLSLSGLSGTPPGFEDMRRNVLSTMKTSHNMEIPTTPIGNNRGKTARANASGAGSTNASRTSGTPTGSNAGGGSGKGKLAGRGKGRAGTKRKRAKEEEESSEEESDSDMSKLGGDSDSDDSEVETQVLPKITQSGRQVNKPAQFVPEAYGTSAKRRAPSKRSQEQALCKRCGRGHSPQNNMIVFCDGCNLGWHQMCHDPSISDETVKDEKAPWYCTDCSRKKGIKTDYETVRGVSWQGKSTDEVASPHHWLIFINSDTV